LGTVEATPKEVVGMFNIFANNGSYVEPHVIKWVKDQWGAKIYRADPEKNQVIPARIADQVAKVMELSINRWRNVLKKELVDSDVMSKTGTTNDSRSCWYAGATPELTTVVYVGCDDNRSMGVNVYPIRTAFPIWTGFHGKVVTTKKQFSYDASLKLVYIHQLTGKMVRRPSDEGAIPILV
jgi:penicillin-binding protein 1A